MQGADVWSGRWQGGGPRLIARKQDGLLLFAATVVVSRKVDGVVMLRERVVEMKRSKLPRVTTSEKENFRDSIYLGL